MHMRQPIPDDEDQLSTEEKIHTLYIYYDDPEQTRWKKHQVIAALMGALTLAFMLVFCFIPTGTTYQIQTLMVPANVQTLQFQAESAIIPTGKKSHPATRARGIVMIYNGSVFTQQLPAHFIVSTHSGLEVETDETVTIEAANPPVLGEVTVSAHVIEAGSQGNIAASAINQTYDGSLFLKNLTAFSGGQDATTTSYATGQDRATALDAAREPLTAEKLIGLQRAPCTETIALRNRTLSVVWMCQYVTYQAPHGVQVLAASLAGANVALTIKRAIRPVVTYFSK